MTDLDKVVEILSSSKYMTLATATTHGQPWVSPLFFVYDKDFNLYWSSSKSAKHSELISENSSVALVIYSSEITNRFWEALYIVGKAHQVSEEEFADALKLYYEKGHPILHEDEKHVLFAKDFSGTAPRRLYKCHPHQVFLLTPPISTSDQQIEGRREISLEELKTKLHQ